MYCKYCGNLCDDDSLFCPKCGGSIKSKPENNVNIENNSPINQTENPTDKNQNNIFENVNNQNNTTADITRPSNNNSNPYQVYETERVNVVHKSKLAAGLLAILVGTLGIHNFYLGFNDKALLQLLLSTIGGIFTCGIATIAVGIWALIEGIMIFSGSIKTDAKGVLLED